MFCIHSTSVGCILFYSHRHLTHAKVTWTLPVCKLLVDLTPELLPLILPCQIVTCIARVFSTALKALLWIIAQPYRYNQTDCGLDSKQRCLAYFGPQSIAQTFRAALVQRWLAWLFVFRNVTVGIPLCLSLEPLHLAFHQILGIRNQFLMFIKQNL